MNTHCYDYSIQDSGGEESDITVRENRPNTRGSVLASQPGVAPTPHRRPAPPAGPGPSINTTRLRRRSTTTNSQANTSNTQRQTGTNTTQRQAGNTPAVSRQNSNPLPRRPAAGRHHTRGRSDSTVHSNATSGASGSLPNTSGALLRARRRSEIQRHLHQNLSNNENEENS